MSTYNLNKQKMKKTQSLLEVSKHQNCLNKISENKIIFFELLSWSLIKGFDDKTSVVLCGSIPICLKKNFVVKFFDATICNIVIKMETVDLCSYDYGFNIPQCIIY